MFLRYEKCPECGHEHVDVDKFAVVPHMRHLCEGCGAFFDTWYSEPGVCNVLRKLEPVLEENGTILFCHMLPAVRDVGKVEALGEQEGE